MQFENLPVEVIQQVFLNLEKDNKGNFTSMKVCKTWFEFGAPIFYKHIQLSRKMPGFLRIDLGLERNIQLRYCRYTKTFTIRDDTLYGAQNQTFINSLEPDQLLYLLQHMPNLKKISFADSDNFHHYMTILRDAPDNLQLLKHVEQINVQSAYKLYWEREIMFRDENEDYDLYFAVYYKFRETLTHLVVHFYHNDLAPQYDLGILGLTGRFSNLTHLQFYHAWADDFTLFEILTTLPHLESLKFVSDFMNLEEAQRGLNEFRQIFKDHEKAVANVKNLRTLYVAVPSFDGAYIDYIVNHCPVNLEDLQIEMMDNDFYNWVQDNTMEKVLKLAKRLSFIKTIRIFTNPYVGGRLPLVGPESKITRFYKILNALIGDRKLFTEATYSETEPSLVEIHIQDNNRLKFQYDLDVLDYREEDADKPFYQQIIPIPNKEVSKIGPEIIHKFNFQVQIYNYGDTLPNQYLDYMLKNCPHLIRFWITFVSRRHPRQEDTYSRFYGGASKDITYLPVPEILPTKQNMTQIRLSGSLLSEEFMDLLTSRLTNLDTLEYTFEKRNMIHHTENEYHFNIDLDVTKALNLQTLHLDMEYVYRDKFDYIFLRINYPGCGEGDNLYQYYFLDTNPDFTYRESFIKKQYIIYPSDASMLDYCGNNQRLKTYTITLKASSKLNTICFSDRERSLTDNAVLVKPTTFSIMQKIEGLLLTDN